MKNYYEILQIPENAGREDIQKSYRRLAKQYHPDVNKSPDAHDKFCEISEAYEFLMNYWPRQAYQYSEPSTYRQKQEEHAKTDAYEKFRQEARDKAQQQARMQYEKFKKQHEAFRESGINDIALLVTIIFRFIGLLFFPILALLPIILSVIFDWHLIFLAIVMWPVGGFTGWYIYENRKGYFMPWKLYYTPQRIRDLFKIKTTTIQPCYYCPAKKADSRPYKLDLLMLKDVKYKTRGYRQHNVNYINQNVSIAVPRSQKAFILHTVVMIIKILSIVSGMIFLGISSLVWRMIVGMAMGWVVSSVLLFIVRTKSSTSYMFSLGMVTRIVIWILCITLASQFSNGPLNIITNDSIYFVITAIILFDSLLMQIVNMIFGKYASQPLIRQYPEVTTKFKEGYVVYNDIPVLSVIYPLFKWIFG